MVKNERLFNKGWLSFVVDGCVRSISNNSIYVARKQFIEQLGIDGSEGLHIRNINIIVKYLKRAFDYGCYYQVFKFLLGSLSNKEDIDFDLIIHKLKEDKRYLHFIDLFYEYIEVLHGKMLKSYNVILYDYDNRLESPREFCDFIISNVLKMDIELENISEDDIDKLMKSVEYNKIPGILFCFMDYFSSYNDKLFFYTLSKYVVPIMAVFEWNEISIETEIKKELLIYYIDWLEFKVLSLNEIFHTGNYGTDFWDKIINQLIGKEEDCIIEVSKQMIGENTSFGINLLKLYELSKDQIKGIMRKEAFTFFTSFVAFILQGEKEDIRAKDFLVDYYDDMRNDYEQAPYKIIMLSKAIISSESFNETNILYGYFLYEQTMFNRNKKPIQANIDEMCDFLNTVYSYICTNIENKEVGIIRNQYIKNNVFEKWGVLELINEIKRDYLKVNNGKKVEMYRKVATIMECLKNPQGIHIGMLAQLMKRPQEDYRYNNDNKMYGALSNELEREANNLYIIASKNMEAALSNRKSYFFMKIDVVMKNLISNQLESEIKNTINQINKLRNIYSAINEESIDEFWEMINPLYESLQSQISAKFIQRNDIAEYYMRLDDGLNCWDKLDDECKNMLITAEIVYQTLANRNDAEKLDYSPAMIPLTKVVEYLLNQLFNKIKINIDYDNLKDKEKTIYGYYEKGNWKVKDSIELGPCIRMMCNGNITWNFKDKSKLYENRSFYIGDISRSMVWQIDNLIKWDKLNQFAGIDVSCNAFDDFEGNNIQIKTFGNNKIENRLILLTALEYIKNAYRNKVAHKDGIAKTRMDMCRDNMIITKKLIWILVYIMDFEIDKI